MITEGRKGWGALGAWQVRRPALILAAATVLTALGIYSAAGYTINSSFTALLPRSTPSVVDLKAAKDRIGSLSTLTVVVETRDLKAAHRFTEALAEKLRERNSPLISRIDWNVSAYLAFLKRHRHFYIPLDKLESLQEGLKAYTNRKKLEANPLFVALDDPPPSPKELIVNLKKDSASQLPKFPGGYYTHPGRHHTFLFIRSHVSGSNKGRSDLLLQTVNSAISELRPSNYAADLRVEFTGDIIGAREEHDAIASELVIATSLTLFFVLLTILIFFRRLRSIPLLGLSLLAPVALTFGITRPLIGELNTATAFLGSIVIGNGVNPLIIWLARFFEERKRLPLAEAVSRTHQETWRATLTASAAASLAYASLTLTDFRGFRDFGVIGGIGMIFCWASAMLLLPCLAAFFDRVRPTESSAPRKTNVYGRALWQFLSRFAKPIWLVSATAAVISVILIGVALVQDPLEYNFDNLKSERDDAGRHRVLNRLVRKTVGKTASGLSLVMLTPSRAQASKLEQLLEKKSEKERPWGTVRTVSDLLPNMQAQKLKIWRELRQMLRDVRAHLSDDEVEQMEAWLPPPDATPLTVDQLPSQVTRPFTEANGVMGRMLFIEEAPGATQYDGRYLIKWASQLRHIRLSDGSRPPLVGRASVFADMIQSIRDDGLKVIAASFAATLLLLLLTFRQRREALLAAAALLLGIAWMGGTMTLFRMRLNFLNFLAYPITFGNGVDYSINVLRRFVSEREQQGSVYDSMKVAIQQSGGAVALCSITTIIGYISLYTSANQALNSFGAAMTISEITCLGAAALSIPAVILLQRRPR